MQISRLLKTIGPGVIFATTCIGVSHLVQSTRAGADYGFSLLLLVILANFFKYPFFEFGSRYTSATGKSIIDGYKKKGTWVLVVYLLITIPSMFIVTAAVTFVTGGLLSNLVGIDWDNTVWSGILILICVVVLAIGRYKVLDSLLKLVGGVLLITTVVAFVSAMFHGRVPAQEGFIPKELLQPTGIIFIVALMGWMPAPVDISTWTGLWSEARIKQTGYRPTLKETLVDFKIGYWISSLLAICFLTLGALIIYGSNTELSNNSTTFAGQIISMFTNAIGPWAYFVIAIAAFSTMFSTTISVLDGYSRSITRTTKLLLDKTDAAETRKAFAIWTIIIGAGSFLIITQFLNNLKSLVDLATIIGFVVAPLAGFLNYKVIYSAEVPEEFRPSKRLKALAVSGLIFLSVFTVVYVLVLFWPEQVSGVFKTLF